MVVVVVEGGDVGCVVVEGDGGGGCEKNRQNLNCKFCP